MQHTSIRLNVADLVVSLRTGPGVRVVGHVESFLADGQPEAAISIRFSGEPDWAGEWHQLYSGQDLGWNAFRTTDGESILVERLGGEMLVRFGPDPGCRFVEVLLKPSGESSASDMACGVAWGRSSSRGRSFMIFPAGGITSAVPARAAPKPLTMRVAAMTAIRDCFMPLPAWRRGRGARSSTIPGPPGWWAPAPARRGGRRRPSELGS